MGLFDDPSLAKKMEQRQAAKQRDKRAMIAKLCNKSGSIAAYVKDEIHRRYVEYGSRDKRYSITIPHHIVSDDEEYIARNNLECQDSIRKAVKALDKSIKKVDIGTSYDFDWPYLEVTVIF